MAEPTVTGTGAITGAGSGNPTGEIKTAVTPPVVDEIQAKIDAALATHSETWKKEIQGLNKRNSELEKKLQEKDLEKLNVEERSKKELELAQAEKDKVVNETISLKRENAVVGKGLDKSFAKLISGKTDEEIEKDVTSLKSFIDKEISKGMEAERNKLLGGGAPRSGNTVQDATLQSQYTEAKAKGDFALATAIQRQATREGVKLT
jgi:hypothetical protein